MDLELAKIFIDRSKETINGVDENHELQFRLEKYKGTNALIVNNPFQLAMVLGDLDTQGILTQYGIDVNHFEKHFKLRKIRNVDCFRLY